MTHMGNAYQSRVGKPGKDGPAFPATEAGDEIVVFAVPKHWQGQEVPSVTLVLNLNAAQLTASEARKLAKLLLEHAAQADEDAA